MITFEPDTLVSEVSNASLPTSLLQPPPGSRPFKRLDLGGLEPQKAITPRQRQVLYCLAEGKPNKRICDELGMSEGTVKVHIAAIFRALRVRNRTQATVVAFREGWLHPGV